MEIITESKNCKVKYKKAYNAWKKIKQRCYNKKVHNYHRYGGRGIEVCDRWRYSFVNFYNDIGNMLIGNLEIDRINNDGNYCKENCRVVTRSLNCSNRGTRNKTGLSGVNKSGSKYISQIKINKKYYYLGLFNTEQEAHEEFVRVHKEWYGF